MAVPVIQSVGSASTGSSSSASTSAPSGVTSGDLLLLFVALDVNVTITTPSGWTSERQQTDGGPSTVRVAVFSRIADGSGSDTPTVTLASSTAWTTVIIRVTGQAGTYTDTSAGGSQTIGTSVTVPSVTTSAANDLLLAFAANDNTGISSDPSGWTAKASATNVCASKLWSKSAGAAGSYGGETFSVTTSADCAVITYAVFAGPDLITGFQADAPGARAAPGRGLAPVSRSTQFVSFKRPSGAAVPMVPLLARIPPRIFAFRDDFPLSPPAAAAAAPPVAPDCSVPLSMVPQRSIWDTTAWTTRTPPSAASLPPAGFDRRRDSRIIMFPSETRQLFTQQAWPPQITPANPTVTGDTMGWVTVPNIARPGPRFTWPPARTDFFAQILGTQVTGGSEARGYFPPLLPALRIIQHAPFPWQPPPAVAGGLTRGWDYPAYPALPPRVKLPTVQQTAGYCLLFTPYIDLDYKPQSSIPRQMRMTDVAHERRPHQVITIAPAAVSFAYQEVNPMLVWPHKRAVIQPTQFIQVSAIVPVIIPFIQDYAQPALRSRGLIYADIHGGGGRQTAALTPIEWGWEAISVLARNPRPIQYERIDRGAVPIADAAVQITQGWYTEGYLPIIVVPGLGHTLGAGAMQGEVYRVPRKHFPHHKIIRLEFHPDVYRVREE